MTHYRANVAVNHNRGHFITDTGNGFQLCRLGPVSHILTLQGEDPIVPLPKKVEFAEDGTVVVAGGDRGKVTLFSATTGAVIQTLPYPLAMVQPVAVSLNSFDSRSPY